MKFGHRGLDNLFEMEPGIVTAFVGAAGTGKTTLALALARGAKTPYLIDTEGISLERVKQVGVMHLKIARVREFEKQHELVTSLKVKPDLLVVDSLVMLYRLKLMEDHKKSNACCQGRFSPFTGSPRRRTSRSWSQGMFTGRRKATRLSAATS